MFQIARLIPLVLLALAVTLNGCNRNTENAKPKFAYITNGVASFWVIAEAGCKQGASEEGVEVEVLMPNGITEQKRMLEDVVTKGLNGAAISPIDPANQVEVINQAAEKINVITHDSDAPDSKRLGYIGMDNYVAGRMCGELVRKSMPEGGKVAIFIGRLEQDNAKRRRQGTIDGMLGRDSDPTRFDPPGEVISEAGFEIVGTYTDQFDRAVGKANVEDVLSRHPDIDGMIGLFAYNPPLILEALKQSDKIGSVKVIGFDEADETLQGIIDGTVDGTVVQNPFEYGRQSVIVLNGLHQGKSLAEMGFDDSNFLNIPARKIDQSNVEEFWAELKKNMGDE